MKMTGERQRVMSYTEFIEVLRFLKKVGSIREIGLFYMGESALNKNLAKFYKYAKEEGFFTFLTTNGTIASTVIEAIPYIDSLKVSWNYKNLDDFIRKTNAPASLFKIIKTNISNFKIKCNEYSKKLTISTILDSSEADYINQLSTLDSDDNYFLPLQS